jgi:3-methyl-2-oxobutanoate hydroxymethyltransferase
MKISRKRYSMVTAYDALTSRFLEEAGVDIILVGDSVGMVLLGYPNTAAVTMEEMLHHAKAVRRGAPKSFVIGDLPKKGVSAGSQQALRSAQRFLGEAKMDGVKIEWGKHALKSTELMVKKKIWVQGHVGLTPQACRDISEFKLQGKTASAAYEIYHQAKMFESAGAKMLLLECIPLELARIITESVKIPTIGIGAGAFCNGQVLVFQDLLGLFDGFKPRFVRRYAELGLETRKILKQFKSDVSFARFPRRDESFSMPAADFEELKSRIQRERL